MTAGETVTSEQAALQWLVAVVDDHDYVAAWARSSAVLRQIWRDPATLSAWSDYYGALKLTGPGWGCVDARVVGPELEIVPFIQRPPGGKAHAGDRCFPILMRYEGDGWRVESYDTVIPREYLVLTGIERPDDW